MNVVLFSASLRDFRPVWLLWPIMLFFSLLVLSFIPAIKEKLCFVRSVRGLKVFAISQCIMLVGHIYAFATQLLPYYMGHYSVVEGNVEEFSAPTNIYNKRETFSVKAFGLNMVILIFHLAIMIQFLTMELYQILSRILEFHMFTIR